MVKGRISEKRKVGNEYGRIKYVRMRGKEQKATEIAVRNGQPTSILPSLSARKILLVDDATLGKAVKVICMCEYAWNSHMIPLSVGKGLQSLTSQVNACERMRVGP